MRKYFVLTVSLAMVLGIALQAGAIHEIIPSETQVAMPGANAEKLGEYITRFNPYRAWQLWPGKGRLYKGTEPHGVLLTTFVSDNALHAIKGRAGMPYDAIIVKENYTAEKRFDALTVMYKLRGYNPAGGDWFWAKYAPDGKVLAAGKVEACISCHARKKNNDFIFTGEVRK